MKTKFIFIGLCALIFSSCTYQRYLPGVDYIDTNEYGSYIKISRWDAVRAKGELIAVDYNNIIILSQKTNQCKIIPIHDIERFTLRYAKPKRTYAWAIPVGTIGTLPFHGVRLIYTAPLNLLVTTGVTLSSISDFRLKDGQISYEELAQFARYPQGIPPNVELPKIK